MGSKICFIIAIAMLIGAVAFVCFAFYHPELSWPFPLIAVKIFYAIYLLCDVIILAFAIVLHKKEDER